MFGVRLSIGERLIRVVCLTTHVCGGVEPHAASTPAWHNASANTRAKTSGSKGVAPGVLFDGPVFDFLGEAEPGGFGFGVDLGKEVFAPHGEIVVDSRIRINDSRKGVSLPPVSRD
uniref:Uncharacterized protein n=1 Tax=Strigamia maritima TaxID=126957 RepID=T1J0C1_STRMM